MSESTQKFRVDVYTSGDSTWSSNYKSYDTELEAKQAATDLMGRWFAVIDWRVVPVDHPRHEKIVKETNNG